MCTKTKMLYIEKRNQVFLPCTICNGSVSSCSNHDVYQRENVALDSQSKPQKEMFGSHEDGG